jgi:membrane-bound ClpP family serine protease
VQTGAEGMVRARGRALDRLAPSGEVMVEGERWRAKAADGPIEPGEEIEVLAEEKLTLLVRRVQETP